MRRSNSARYRKALTFAVFGAGAIAAALLLDYLMAAYISPQSHSEAGAPYAVAMSVMPHERPRAVPGRHPATPEIIA